MVTIVTYEEWKQLPGAESGSVGVIEEHPEWFRFGKDEAGKAVAQMTKEGTDAYLSSLEEKVGLPPNTLDRVD